jgi:modulator of FtsH protease
VAPALSTNKVIRNTYMLLSMTLAFAALTAGVSMSLNLPHPGLIITLVGYFGLLFLTTKFRNSGLGICIRVRADRLHGLHAGPDPQRLPVLPNGSQSGDDGDGRHCRDLPRPVRPMH